MLLFSEASPGTNESLVWTEIFTQQNPCLFSHALTADGPSIFSFHPFRVFSDLMLIIDYQRFQSHS